MKHKRGVHLSFQACEVQTKQWKCSHTFSQTLRIVSELPRSSSEMNINKQLDQLSLLSRLWTPVKNKLELSCRTELLARRRKIFNAVCVYFKNVSSGNIGGFFFELSVTKASKYVCYKCQVSVVTLQIAQSIHLMLFVVSTDTDFQSNPCLNLFNPSLRVCTSNIYRDTDRIVSVQTSIFFKPSRVLVSGRKDWTELEY